MNSDQEIAADISTALERLTAKLQEHQRDLQRRNNPEGAPLVRSAREVAERLWRDLHSIRDD
jgi:hypothetical protein